MHLYDIRFAILTGHVIESTKCNRDSISFKEDRGIVTFLYLDWDGDVDVLNGDVIMTNPPVFCNIEAKYYPENSIYYDNEYIHETFPDQMVMSKRAYRRFRWIRNKRFSKI